MQIQQLQITGATMFRKAMNDFKLSDPWDCKACPISADLLRWLDDVSRANADLETQNKRLIEIASRQS
jgi:hypothetical protein